MYNIDTCYNFISDSKIVLVKYFPKENTYEELYLMNEFERDIMENGLQNMRKDSTKTSQTSLRKIKQI